MPHAILVPVCEANMTELMDLGEELTALSSYKVVFDREWATRMARMGMNSPDYFGRVAMLKDGTCCGFIVGSVTQMLLSPSYMAVEETIYVRDKTPFRASIAKQLMSALVHWSFAIKGAAFLRAGETSEISPKAVDAFFRSQGFRRNGTVYIKEPI